ncbi:MAG: Glycine--tRNA ligase beta subunit [Holosporales bacterium]
MQFLLELSVEEIPARMQCQASADFKRLFSSAFCEAGIVCHEIESYITPRRQVVIADIDPTTQEMTESKRGPKIGAPQPAIDGFLKSTGLFKDALYEENGYYYACIKKPAVQTESLLANIIETVLKAHPWPKVMRYPGSSLPWVRPIRGVLCLFNNQALTLHLPSINLTTQQTVTGHRFMAPIQKAVSTVQEYLDFLKNHYVVLSHEDRKNMIKTALNQSLISMTWIEDEALLEEVAGLSEYPFVYIGKIEQNFMNLPACVLTTSMRVHQKYFAFKDEKTGTLAPYFGVVANFKPENDQIMMKGFEKVLRARLTDASFFYDLDSKTPLASYDEKLNHIVYQHHLGTLKDKLNRMKSNAYFEQTPALSMAIDLSKSDLLTQMVGEFPELQGMMGRIYAAQEGIDPDVALSLETYYLPQSPQDDLPTSQTAIHLSILDKMDALVGFLKIGFKPSGSKDPYALRRQALGIIRLALHQQNMDLRKLIHDTIHTFSDQPVAISVEVESFILERFNHFMQNTYPKDVINAVLKSIGDGALNLWVLARKIDALNTFLNTEDGALLKQIYKRAVGVSKDGKSMTVNPALFELPQENELWESIQKAQKESAAALQSNDFMQAFHVLKQVKPPLYTFFEHVLVCVDNKAVQENRQALLKQLVNYIQSLADIG